MKGLYQSEMIEVRKERVRRFLREESPGGPLAYFFAMGYVDKKRGGGRFGSRGEYKNWEVMLEGQLEMVKALVEVDNDNIPYLWPYTCGPHFTASLFGCPVSLDEHGAFWAERLPLDFGKDPIPQADLAGAQMERIIEEIRFLQERSPYRLPIALPDSSSPICAASVVLGMEEFLVHTVLSPEKMREFALQIAETIVLAMKKISAAIDTEPVYSDRKSWLPREYKMLMLCATQMIRPDTYENLFREADERILNEFDEGGIIHLCGDSTHMIPVFRDMPKVKGIELQGNPEADYDPAKEYRRYLDGMREDQTLFLFTTGLDLDEVLRTVEGKRVILRVAAPEGVQRVRTWEKAK